MEHVYFEYGSYKNDVFLHTLPDVTFAVAYSPGETMGLYHVEIHAHGIPMFILDPKAVHFFSNLSGVVVDSKRAKSTDTFESGILNPFQGFSLQLKKFSSIQDLNNFGFFYSKCGAF